MGDLMTAQSFRLQITAKRMVMSRVQMTHPRPIRARMFLAVSTIGVDGLA